MSNWQKSVYSKKFKTKPSEDWPKIKLAIWHREHGKCQRCEKRTRVEKDGATAHHLIPRSEGGSDDWSNLVWLCSTCHDFIEINDLRTIADIEGSYNDSEIDQTPILQNSSQEESFERPAWHAWVYGGQPNPEKNQ